MEARSRGSSKKGSLAQYKESVVTSSFTKSIYRTNWVTEVTVVMITL